MVRVGLSFNFQSRLSLEEIRKNNFIHGSSLYRRATFVKVGGYLKKGRRPEDSDLFTRMLETGLQAIRCAEPLLEYRQHSADQANLVLGSIEQIFLFRRAAQDLERRLVAKEQELQRRLLAKEQALIEAKKWEIEADLWHARLDDFCALPWYRFLIHAVKRKMGGFTFKSWIKGLAREHASGSR